MGADDGFSFANGRMLSMIRRILVALSLGGLLFALAANARGGAKFNKVLDIGNKAPAWKDLKGTDDKTHSLADHKQAKFVVITFTCNHCPVAASYEERFINFARKYKEKGVEFVAISCSSFEDDNFDAMKKHAQEKNYPFAYLHDADQSVGKSFGASSTPQLFVLDGERKVAYMGAFDDNFVESEVKHHYLTDAIDALLAGKKPEVAETRAPGCRIEYPR